MASLYRIGLFRRSNLRQLMAVGSNGGRNLWFSAGLFEMTTHDRPSREELSGVTEALS